jgi:hypothetical protein
VIQFFVILAFAFLSCATSRARVEPAGPRVAIGSDPARATVTRSADIRPPRCEVPKLRTIPAEPVVDWLSKGCPATFMACLSGSDFESMRLYLQSIRQWAHDAERGCHASR